MTDVRVLAEAYLGAGADKGDGTCGEIVNVTWLARFAEIVRADKPRCDQCRWWTPLAGGRGTCDVPEPRYESQEDTLVTAPDFGCVQFEAKP